MTIAIIGAGITGLTTAYFLARKGIRDITVYDKLEGPARQTSFANGGQLSVSNSEVWNTWPTVWKGMKWMLRKDAPLLFNPSFSAAKYKWIWQFLQHTAAGNQHSTDMTISYGKEARDLYRSIAILEGIQFDLRKEGILHFYRDEKTFAAGRKSAAMYRSRGVNRVVVDQEEILSIEPSLIQNIEGIVGGTYTKDDMSGDIHLFCTGLERVLKTKYDVKFQYSTVVTDITRMQTNIMLTLDQIDTAEEVLVNVDNLIICGGADSERLANLVGDSVGVYPVKGYSITIPLYDSNSRISAPTLSLLDEATKIVSSRLGDRLRVAGTAELNGWDYSINEARIKPLTNWVAHNFPGINLDTSIKTWAGLRPMTPNMFPVVRHSIHDDRIIFNTGHGHLGWTLGAYTATLVANLFK